MALYSFLKLIALGALFHEAAAFATVADPAPAKQFNTYDECVAFAADYDKIVNYCGYFPCYSTNPYWQSTCPPNLQCPRPGPDAGLVPRTRPLSERPPRC